MNAVPAVDSVDLQTPSFSAPVMSMDSPRFADTRDVIYIRDFTADGSGSTTVMDPYNYGFVSAGHYYLPALLDADITDNDRDLAKGVSAIYALAGEVLSINPEIDNDMDAAFHELFGVPSEEAIG